MIIEYICLIYSIQFLPFLLVNNYIITKIETLNFIEYSRFAAYYNQKIINYTKKVESVKNR